MKKKNKITISILGCGRVAEHYFKIFKLIKKNKAPLFKIEAVCDVDKKKAFQFSKKFNCKPYQDYKLMLKEISSDLICILTPSGDHYKHTKLALKKNFNVMVEKPICLIPRQAEELLKISKRKKLNLTVAFQNRYNKAIVCLKNALKKKRFGKIISVAVVLRWCRYQSYYNDEWHGTWKNDGGVISQQAIHHIDALNWLLGPVQSVSALTTNRLNKLEAEDTTVGILKLKNGALCTLEATTAARPKDFEASISVVGEKGTVKVAGVALNKIVQWNFINKQKHDKIIKKKYSQKFINGYGLSHISLFVKVFRNIIKRKRDYNSLIQSINTTKILHSLYRSDEVNRLVKLNSYPVSRRLGV